VFYSGEIHKKVFRNSHQKTADRHLGATESRLSQQLKLTDTNLKRLYGTNATQRHTRVASTSCADGNTVVSLATSQQTVIKTRHLRARLFQRGVEVEQVQLARKHGRRVRLRNGNLAFVYQGVTYITDSTGRIGVTTWSKSGKV